MDQLPRLGKRELICLLLFTCNYVVFVWRGFLFLWVLGMGYVILLWHSLSLPYNYFNGTKAYNETSIDEKYVVYSHSNEIPKMFAVDVKERQDRLPTMYWLPKLHKRPYKVRFIANSSSCTTTELSKLLTSCLTAIKAKVIKYCETVYERSGKNMFWPLKNLTKYLVN